MVERGPWPNRLTHAGAWLGIALLGLPLYIAVVAASHDVNTVNSAPMPWLPGAHLAENVEAAWVRGNLGRQLLNSAVMALGIAVGKVALATLSAFAIVYFRFRFRAVAFWLIFASLLMPVEIRIVPTYEVMANVLTPFVAAIRALGIDAALGWAFGGVPRLAVRWSMLNSYEGLILPLIASATATFLFRQVFMTIPDELAEAATIDGAGPMRFFWWILLPLSKANVAAMLVVMFVYGWNQFLWPLLVTTKPEMSTIVMGIMKLMPGMDSRPLWNQAMAAAVLATLPPVLVVIVLQRWFVQGLVEAEK